MKTLNLLKLGFVTVFLSVLASCSTFDGLADEIEKNPVVAGAVVQEVTILAIKQASEEDRLKLSQDIQEKAQEAITFFEGEFVTVGLIDSYIAQEYDYSKMRPSEIAVVELLAARIKAGLAEAISDPASGLSENSLFTVNFVLENAIIGAKWYSQAN